MRIIEILQKLLIPKLFFSFAPDGDGGAGGDEGDGGAGAPSSGVKNDVTPETHFKDEKGVPYYNRYREMEEKYKGVDLDLYGRAKEFDFDEAEEALEFKNLVYSDQKKLEKVLAVLKGEAEDAIDPTKSKANQSPEAKALLARIEKLEGVIQGFQQAEHSKNQNSWMEKYDSGVETSIAESLKLEAFKELGGKLSDFDKRVVSKLVDDVFAADASKGKQSKLSHNDIPKVVQDVLSMVLENRKGTLSGMLRKDGGPDPIKGDGASGQPKQKPMGDKERIESGAKFIQEQRAQSAAS